jgi:glycogen operon protein
LREPWHSINFVTCHDGFTLADLVSYNDKHNEANGEENHDGSNDNCSWNCGVEGPSSSPEVNHLRSRQVRNLATLLMLSQGVPMILAGDEVGRSQSGNNNAYCQDNEVSWFNWNLLESNADLLRFFRLLIRLRRDHPLLRRGTFSSLAGPNIPRVEWHGVRLHAPDWSQESRSLAMHLHGPPENRQDHIYLIANAHWEPHEFELPGLPGWEWVRSVDTSRAPPCDITDPSEQEMLTDPLRYLVNPRSVVVLVGCESGKPAVR